MNAPRLPALLLLACLAADATTAGTPPVRTGIEVLRDRGFDLLRGKRVGLVTNATAVDRGLRATLDILHRAPSVRLTAVFGPEHGARGEFAAGDKVENYTDARTGLPVYSLYGRTRKPTSAMLENVDVLVYDIQDIGVRSYTYIATMGQAMEAAAEKGIPFVVLDRPNPLGGLRIEGNLVEPGFTSFVSPFPIPYVYGLTCGELAQMINGEGWLAGGARCSLTVVRLEGWKRGMMFEETGLPWVPTSPHVPSVESPRFYVATGVLGELGVISEGVGFTIPFQVFAAEWIDAARFRDTLAAMRIPGMNFRPVTFKPFYGRSEGATLHGVQIYFTDPAAADLLGVQFRLLEAHHRLHPDKDPFAMAEKSRIGMFDRVAGTDRIRKLFQKAFRYEDVRGELQKDVAPFRTRSARYRLYAD